MLAITYLILTFVFSKFPNIYPTLHPLKMSFIHLNFNGQPFKDTQVVGSELNGLEGLVVPSSIHHIINPLDYKMSHEQKGEIV